MDHNGEKKKEILEMLANKEISKEEAEKKLSELGSPVEEQQQTQSKPKGKKNIGCLIVLIIGIVLIPVILIILFLGFILLNVEHADSSRESIGNIINEMGTKEMEMGDMDSSGFRDEMKPQPVRVYKATDPKEIREDNKK